MTESKQRIIRQLTDDDGSTLAEIAEKTGIHPETLLSRYRRNDRGARLRRPVRFYSTDRAREVAHLRRQTRLTPWTIRQRLEEGIPVDAPDRRLRIIGGKTYAEWSASIERMTGHVCRPDNVAAAIYRQRRRLNGDSSDEKVLACALDCLLRSRGVDVRERISDDGITGSPAEKGRG